MCFSICFELIYDIYTVYNLNTLFLLINCVNSKYKYKFVFVYHTPINSNCYISSSLSSILKERGECNVMY